MNEIEQHYNKFNEEKRLDSRHGKVEYITSMKYIHKYIPTDRDKSEVRILDIGAGTGRYSVALAEEGYDVTAIELVKHNLGLLKAKNSSVKAKQGNALNLKKYPENYYDVVLLFGPMYHLYTYEDKLKALTEARRVCRVGGVILVAYIMNEYGVITYGFKEKHIMESLEKGKLTDDFQIVSEAEDLYDYMRLENINKLNEDADLERIQIITPDGPANFIRPFLNALTEEEFDMFIKYHLSICERQDILGASAHTLDVLRKMH